MAYELGNRTRVGASDLKIVWTNEAVRDLSAARDYVAKDNPIAAAKLASRIVKATAKLIKHPDIGRKGRLRGTRELVIPRTPYFIPYRVREDRIELLRVDHGARFYPPKT